jgi:hypothetical protein
MRHRLSVLGFVCCAAATGCIDITVDSEAIGSLEFVPFPYPSIDAGDTLRDSLGRATPLRANVYRADGAIDPSTPATFISLDTVVTGPSTGGFIVGRLLNFSAGSFTARFLATAGTLQSQPRSIVVVPAPDTIFSLTPSQVDTIRYSAPAAASDTSRALGVKLNGKNAGAPIGVPSYLVRYSIRNTAGQLLPTTDTTQAFFLVDDAGRLSSVDTTDASGMASRRLRFRIRQGQAAIDSVRVMARVSRGLRLVPGDSVTWRVVVRPKA